VDLKSVHLLNNSLLKH